MPEAYIIDAVRTAVGKRNGALAKVHPIDLGVYAFRGLFDRVDVDPAAVDDVIVGCVDAIGGQAGNIGRNAWLASAYCSISSRDRFHRSAISSAPRNCEISSSP